MLSPAMKYLSISQMNWHEHGSQRMFPNDSSKFLTGITLTLCVYKPTYRWIVDTDAQHLQNETWNFQIQNI